jgi:hypothetical protein
MMDVLIRAEKRLEHPSASVKRTIGSGMLRNEHSQDNHQQKMARKRMKPDEN